MIIRERVNVVDGESQITKTIHNPDLEQAVLPILTELKLYGHVVLQLILDENKEIHIIECNSRFGGASAASIAAGLDSFYWFLLESEGEVLEDYPFLRSAQSITQVRFPMDHYL